MAIVETTPSDLTATDLAARFGPISLRRIRTVPPPGEATVDDLADVNDRKQGLVELYDGMLVEKDMGSYESLVATNLGRIIGNFVAQHQLGYVLGEAGTLVIHPGEVRAPDVSFISWERLPGRKRPRERVWRVVPDLAVEVISRGNTAEEMENKLTDYFTAGVRLVWYVYPNKREVHVYTTREKPQVFGEADTLEGGDVLPGLNIPVKEVFAEESA